MKLGLYGGGFKPFTTGHFARLADAIHDNDKVYLFYGMQQVEPIRYGKKGQQLKSKQKFRDIGKTGRMYDEKVAESIFQIYKTALERIPEVEVILVQSQARDEQGNLAAVRAPVTAIFKNLEEFVENPDMYEKVTIYGDKSSMAPYMKSPKFKDLVRVGKLQFGGAIPENPEDYLDPDRLDRLMTRGEEEARDALRGYYADLEGEDRKELSDEDITQLQSVRGTRVRDLAASPETAEEAKRYLPPFLNSDEKDKIIQILLGSIDESLIKPAISESVIKRAATKFSAIRLLSEQDDKSAVGPGEEAHIYNLYEELGMPLKDIIEIGHLGLKGKLENVQEKMDGQFLAFTVVDGQLRFFTKMDLQSQRAKDKRLESIRAGGPGGGMILDQIMSAYTGDRSNIADGFAIAYEALEPVALPYQDSLFRNGEVVMASQIMVSKNPNTILYNEDSLRTVLAISLTGEPVNQDALSSFKSEMRDSSTDAFTMDEVPTASLMKGLDEDDSELEQLEKDLESVVTEVGLSISNNTVGDYVKARLEEFIREKYEFIPDDFVPGVADRFMTGKGRIALQLKKVVSPEEYQHFRSLDKVKTRVVQEAIVPLENIIQRLGIMIIDKLDLALQASNQEDLLGFVKDVRGAFESGFNFGLGSEDEKTLEGIRVALARLEANEDLFTRATEGIVFTHNNKTYKLTGLFTPINRLRGFFSYGKAKMPDRGENKDLSETVSNILMKILSEGGNAFKDSENNIVTSPDPISREEAERIIKDINIKLLSTLGLEFVSVGSTSSDATGRKSEWKPTEFMGDIDLLVDVPDELLIDTEDQRTDYRDPNLQGLTTRQKSARARRQREIESGKRNESPYKDTLFIALSNHPYLQGELVPGVPRVLDASDGSRILVRDSKTGKLRQVDIDLKRKGRSFDDAAWERAGGGQGQAKGRYRNLMLSFIAKLISLDQSTEDKEVKVTVALGHGYTRKEREKIDGVWGEWEDTENILDPDSYLSELGLHVSKNSIKSFEQLVDYMAQNPNKIFNQALTVGPPNEAMSGGFDEYVRRPQWTDENEIAFSYIRKKQDPQSLAESHFRNSIRRLLNEDVVEEKAAIPLVNVPLSEKKGEAQKVRALLYENSEAYESAKSFTEKSRVIFDMLKSPDFFGSDIQKIINVSGANKLVRLGLAPGADDRHDINKILNLMYDSLSPDRTRGIIELAPDEHPNPSSKYLAYVMPDLDDLMVIFGIAGVTGGQRKAGYVYEIDVGENLKAAGIQARSGEDNSVSDVYVPMATGMLGIEVKLPNAQAGEPTLKYDFDKGEFFASNPKPQNQDIADLINMDPTAPEVNRRLTLVRDVINGYRAENDMPEIESILAKISKKEYRDVVLPALRSKGENISGALLAVYTVSADVLRKYYMLKKASLVKVKGKGLFHLHPDFKITLTDESGNSRSSEFFDFSPAQGAVYFRNFRGGNYGIRSQLKNSPLRRLKQAGIDLDAERDRDEFAKLVSTLNLPDPMSVAAESSSEPTNETAIVARALKSLILRYNGRV